MEIEKNNLDNTQHWLGMELSSGEVKSYFSQATNQIFTRKYALNHTMITLLLCSFKRLENICLIATIITLIAMPNSAAFGLELYGTELVFLLIVFLTKEIYFDKVKGDSDAKINQRTVKVYRGAEQYPQMPWGELKQGDVVYLTNGEVAPADILLLDSQQIQHRQAITYVDTRNVNGQIHPTKKKGCYLTQMVNRGILQKRNWDHYRKIITGKLTYQKPTDNLNNFIGYLKLSKDPKVQKLSIENMILRQSSIKTSLWVYGLVIYPGMDSKIMMHVNHTQQKISTYQKKLQFIYICCLILNLILGTIYSFIYMFSDKKRQSLEIAGYHYIMFSILLPNTLFISINLLMLFYSLTKNISKVYIRNFMSMMNLGNIDFAVLANIGVISSGEVTIDQIVTASSVYQIKGDQSSYNKKRTGLPGQRRHASSVRQDQLNIIGNNRNKMPYMCISNQTVIFNQKNYVQQQKFQIDDQTQGRLILQPLHNNQSLKLKTHLQPLKINRQGLYNYVKQNQNQSTQIIKSIVLCHRAKLFYNPQKQVYRGISSIKSQQVLLKLANYVGWEIQPKIQFTKQLGIIVRQEIQKIDQNGYIRLDIKNTMYQWIGINNFQIQRKLFSIVAKTDNKYVLYCKGKPQDIMDRLKINKQTQKIIDNTLLSYKQKDKDIIIYSKRQLTFQEKQIYQNQYASLKLSLNTTQLQIQQFSKKYQKNLQFICIVGLSTQINPKAQQFINFLYDSNIKICMLDSNRSQIASFKSLLNRNNTKAIEYIYLDQSSTQLLRYYLDYATNKYYSQKQYKYALIINGQAYKLMQSKSNSDIMQHFMFMVYHGEGLLGFDFCANLAGDLTNRLKTSFPREHCVLGVGYSYCDLKFLDEANVGIGLSYNLPTDIKTDDLGKVTQIIQLGPYLLENLYLLTNLIIYRITCLGTIIFIYQTVLICYNSSFTLNSILVFIYLIVDNFIQIIFTIFINRKTTKLKSPAFYANFPNYAHRIKITLIQAIFHGTVIIGATLLILPSVRIANGQLLPIQSFHMTIFILLITINNFKYYFNQKMTKILLLIRIITSLIIITICLILSSLIQSSFIAVSTSIYYLITNYDCITFLINTSIFCLGISLLLRNTIQKILFPQMNDKYSKKLQNQLIIKNIEPQISTIQLIKHLFKDQQNIDSSLSILVADQIDINTLKINNFMQIRNKQSNIKYLYQNCQTNIRAFMRALIIFISFLLVIFLANILISKKIFHSQILLLVSIIIMIIILIYIWKAEIFMNYYFTAQIILGLIVIIGIIYPLIKDINTIEYLILSVIIVTITQLLEIRFIVLLGFCIVICFANIITSITKWQSRQTILTIVTQIIYTIIIVFINMFSMCRILTSSKINFIIHQNFEKQTNHVNDILSILVPKFVKNYLENKNQNTPLQQQQNKIAILFCYVCNFDQIVKEQGKNVVLLMDQLFRQFDQLCHNFAVQKIQTVGMTYMAATGITDYQQQIQNQMTKKNQVQRLLKMGIQMLDKAKSITWGQKKNKRLKIKIGIHAGGVIVGVIGFHKPQFSLIGDTVNTTSRHCSTAHPGQIVLSQTAFQMVKRFPMSSFQKSTKQMKGLGSVSIYRYLRNQSLQSRHLQVKLRFINIVKKVIQKLKQQGKIKYKKFKASQLAEHAMIARASTKKITITDKGMRRSSVLMLQQHLQQVQLNHRSNEFQLKHNIFLQLSQKNIRYNSYLTNKYYYVDRLLIGLLIIVYIAQLIINITNNLWNPIFLVIRIIGIILYLLTILFYKHGIVSNLILWIFTLFHIYIHFSIQLQQILITRQSIFHNFTTSYALLSLTVLSAMYAYRFIHILIISLVAILFTGVGFILKGSFEIDLVYEIFYFIFILIRKYTMIKNGYQNYTQILAYEKRSQQQSALVSQLLPKHAYQKLKNQNIQNRLELTDKFENATMLFADIKGFTSFSNRSTPAGVVKMLRQLFEQFDKSCLKYNVYKVYTIGDCYVVLGFTDCYKRNILEQTKNVVNMGFSMVQTIQKVREKLNFPQLDMRIGIHTGTIIGGIIGTQIVRYDIYGPDVMIANKFQQNGKTGFVHISQSTKQILQQDKKKLYNITPNGTVKIQKLNVQINGYILTRKKFQL